MGKGIGNKNKLNWVFFQVTLRILYVNPKVHSTSRNFFKLWFLGKHFLAMFKKLLTDLKPFASIERKQDNIDRLLLGIVWGEGGV